VAGESCLGAHQDEAHPLAKLLLLLLLLIWEVVVLLVMLLVLLLALVCLRGRVLLLAPVHFLPQQVLLLDLLTVPYTPC
jgi:hypothetical protein